MLGLKILQSANPKNPSSDKINNKKIEINCILSKDKGENLIF